MRYSSKTICKYIQIKWNIQSVNWMDKNELDWNGTHFQWRNVSVQCGKQHICVDKTRRIIFKVAKVADVIASSHFKYWQKFLIKSNANIHFSHSIAQDEWKNSNNNIFRIHCFYGQCWLVTSNNSNNSGSITSLNILWLSRHLDSILFVYSTRLYPTAETRSRKSKSNKAHSLGHAHTQNLKKPPAYEIECYKHIIKNLEISGLCTPGT